VISGDGRGLSPWVTRRKRRQFRGSPLTIFSPFADKHLLVESGSQRVARRPFVPLSVGEKFRVQEGRRKGAPSRSDEPTPAAALPADSSHSSRRFRPIRAFAKRGFENLFRPHPVHVTAGSDHEGGVCAVDGSLSAGTKELGRKNVRWNWGGLVFF
jgi:hypothetical protein